VAPAFRPQKYGIAVPVGSTIRKQITGLEPSEACITFPGGSASGSSGGGVTLSLKLGDVRLRTNPAVAWEAM
jgi:hypothetical protein